jgi:hypothetical protein
MFTQLSENLKIVFEVHPQLSKYGHPMDGVLMGPGSLWPYLSPPKEKQRLETNLEMPFKFRSVFMVKWKITFETCLPNYLKT